MPEESLGGLGPRLGLRRIPVAIIVAVLLGLFARTFIFETFEVESASMSPALIPGDHILVSRLAYVDFGGLLGLAPGQPPRRGDVVVLERPGGVVLIKRIVALPGEVLEVRGGEVWLDGALYEEPWAIPASDEIGPIRLRSREIYVLGDQRPVSRDSRHWGPAQKRWLQGKAILIYWSSQRMEPAHDWGKIMSNAWEKVLSTRWERWLRPVR